MTSVLAGHRIPTDAFLQRPVSWERWPGLVSLQSLELHTETTKALTSNGEYYLKHK